MTPKSLRRKFWFTLAGPGRTASGSRGEPAASTPAARRSPSAGAHGVASSRSPRGGPIAQLAKAQAAHDQAEAGHDTRPSAEGYTQSFEPFTEAVLSTGAPSAACPLRNSRLCFPGRFHLGRHAGAAVGLLALVALLGLAYQHLAHLVVDEVVEQPAGVGEDLARGGSAARGRAVPKDRRSSEHQPSQEKSARKARNEPDNEQDDDEGRYAGRL